MRKKIEDIKAVHIANPKTAEFQVSRMGDFIKHGTSLPNIYFMLYLKVTIFKYVDAPLKFITNSLWRQQTFHYMHCILMGNMLM